MWEKNAPPKGVKNQRKKGDPRKKETQRGGKEIQPQGEKMEYKWKLR